MLSNYYNNDLIIRLVLWRDNTFVRLVNWFPSVNNSCWIAQDHLAMKDVTEALWTVHLNTSNQ